MEKEARRIFDPILAMSNSKGETMRTRPTLKYSVDDQDLWVYMPAGSVAKKVRGRVAVASFWFGTSLKYSWTIKTCRFVCLLEEDEGTGFSCWFISKASEPF